MERRIKLIWDFKGPNAAKTAEHHEIHLKEYVHVQKLTETLSGFQHITEMHSIAFLIVPEKNMKIVRDDLKPHRGQLHTTES